jgi:hypothetical protein
LRDACHLGRQADESLVSTVSSNLHRYAHQAQALYGGYQTVFLMANTMPTIDNILKDVSEFAKQNNKLVSLLVDNRQTLTNQIILNNVLA